MELGQELWLLLHGIMTQKGLEFRWCGLVGGGVCVCETDVLSVYYGVSSNNVDGTESDRCETDLVFDYARRGVLGCLPLAKALLDLGVQSTTAGTRPVRLPLSDSLLETLHDSRDLTDLPLSSILVFCLRRSAARKRRRKSPSKKGTDK